MKKVLSMCLSIILILILCYPAYSEFDFDNMKAERQIIQIKKWILDQKIPTNLNHSWGNAMIEYNCMLSSLEGEKYSHFTLHDNDHNYLGYIIANEKNEVLEFSFSLSPYESYFKQGNLFYTPGYHMIQKGNALYPIKVKSSIESLSGESNNHFNSVTSYPDYSKIISGVPDYTATNNIPCIPTAIGNVIGYWDTHGYPNLMTGTSQAMLTEINNLMGCNNQNSSVIKTTVEGYCHQNNRYPNNFTVTSIHNPTFNQFKSQIVYNRPTLVGFSTAFQGYNSNQNIAHMTTGVGYYYTLGSTDRYIYVHDGWPTTAVDYFVKWGAYNDYIHTIVP